MRLINTSTLDFGEFSGDIPEYAILSHAWETNGEIRYEQWIDRKTSPITHLSGYQKILGACHKARSHYIKWLWVDTNCIDKRSSAELTEAINSMFDWYHESVVCYVFMADVQTPANPSTVINPDFTRSRWFTRGWTLQELLAPKEVVFYDSDWVRLGTRNGSLLSIISKVTKIGESALCSVAAMSDMSVAAKMSWMSRRRTTRVEDMAYCMLGIFNLNMPLLYREGHKAFIRLQEEIIKKSFDQSIFCWAWTDDVPHGWTSILSPSPRTFQWAADYAPCDADNVAPYQITNRGLQIFLHLGIQIWSPGYFWVSLSVTSKRYPLYRACIPISWSPKSGHKRKIYLRHAWPREPVMLDAWCVMQMTDLCIETLPSRFDRPLMKSYESKMPSKSRSLVPFDVGMILLLPRCGNLGKVGSMTRGFEIPFHSLPPASDTPPGLFILSPSRDRRAPVSYYQILYFGNNLIYVGVKRNIYGKRDQIPFFEWYFKSWKPSYKAGTNDEIMEKGLKEANDLVKCIQNEQLGNFESWARYRVEVNAGQVVDFGARGESRIICLGEDFNTLKVLRNELEKANDGDVASDLGSLVANTGLR